MRKESLTTIASALMLICLLAFILGLVLAGDWNASPEHQLAMESLHLTTAAKMSHIKIVFWGGLVVVCLVGLSGLVGGVLRMLWRRSRLIRPEPTGLYPIIEGHRGGQTYYHDPNRQLAGTTAFGASSEGVMVRHLSPPGQEQAQFQIATQAQAAQFVAAASQGHGLDASSRRLVERVALQPPARPAPRLPDVVVLSEIIPEERRLLTALRQDWEEGE